MGSRFGEEDFGEEKKTFGNCWKFEPRIFEVMYDR
jgi:hypothetical protein